MTIEQGWDEANEHHDEAPTAAVDEQPTTDPDGDRLRAINLLVEPFTCSPGDDSFIGYAIRAIATGKKTPERAIADLGDEWADTLAEYCQGRRLTAGDRVRVIAVGDLEGATGTYSRRAQDGHVMVRAETAGFMGEEFPHRDVDLEVIARYEADDEPLPWSDTDESGFRIAEHLQSRPHELEAHIKRAHTEGNTTAYLALCSLRGVLHDRARILAAGNAAPAAGDLSGAVCALTPGGKPLGPVERAAVEGFQRYLGDRRAWNRLAAYLRARAYWVDDVHRGYPIHKLSAPRERPEVLSAMELLEADVRLATDYLGQRLAAYEAPVGTAAPGDLADVLDSLIRVFRVEDNPAKTLQQFYVTSEDERRRWLAALEQAAQVLGVVGIFTLCGACKSRPGQMDGGLCGGCYDQAVRAELAGDFAGDEA